MAAAQVVPQARATTLRPTPARSVRMAPSTAGRNRGAAADLARADAHRRAVRPAAGWSHRLARPRRLAQAPPMAGQAAAHGAVRSALSAPPGGRRPPSVAARTPVRSAARQCRRATGQVQEEAGTRAAAPASQTADDEVLAARSAAPGSNADRPALGTLAHSTAAAAGDTRLEAERSSHGREGRLSNGPADHSRWHRPEDGPRSQTGRIPAGVHCAAVAVWAAA